jgi:energy-coupling factor transport system ATP-binding protein
MLALKNIYKSFQTRKFFTNNSINKKVLSNVNLNFQKGSINLINGNNGSGKTTLLRIIAGITLPDEGYIYFDGKRLDSNIVSYTSNNSRGFFWRISAFENLKYFFTLNHCCSDRGKIRDLADAFSIKEKLDKPLQELSLGEIQKINLIRGIGVDSEIFLFDEAEASLDNSSKDYLLSHLGQLKRKNKLIINVSHEATFLLNKTDQVISSNDFNN